VPFVLLGDVLSPITLGGALSNAWASPHDTSTPDDPIADRDHWVTWFTRRGVAREDVPLGALDRILARFDHDIQALRVPPQVRANTSGASSAASTFGSHSAPLQHVPLPTQGRPSHGAHDMVTDDISTLSSTDQAGRSSHTDTTEETSGEEHSNSRPGFATMVQTVEEIAEEEEDAEEDVVNNEVKSKVNVEVKVEVNSEVNGGVKTEVCEDEDMPTDEVVQDEPPEAAASTPVSDPSNAASTTPVAASTTTTPVAASTTTTPVAASSSQCCVCS
jgi:hypothetical protein